jgi:Sulfotransferase family
VRAVAQLVFGDQSPASIGEALAWLRRRADWTGADVLDHLLAVVRPRPIVEKSPENAMTATALDRLSAAYPRARYVHLVRHPNSSARSMREHWASNVPADPLPAPAVSCLVAWFDVNRRIARFAAGLPANRYLVVRAEDLLGDLTRHLRRIARWLGVRDDAAAVTAMRHPEASPFARLGTAGSGVSGGNDRGFLADPIPRRVALPSSVERPLEWNEDPELWGDIVELAARFGYDGTRSVPPTRLAS